MTGYQHTDCIQLPGAGLQYLIPSHMVFFGKTAYDCGCRSVHSTAVRNGRRRCEWSPWVPSSTEQLKCINPIKVQTEQRVSLIEKQHHCAAQAACATARHGRHGGPTAAVVSRTTTTSPCRGIEGQWVSLLALPSCPCRRGPPTETCAVGQLLGKYSPSPQESNRYS
jgi:hypothetical protein